MASASPRDPKKKKEAKKWRGFGNPVAKIFNRKDSDKKITDIDSKEETSEGDSPSSSPQAVATKGRTQTVSSIAHGSGGAVIRREKPHPLLRPKSLVSISVDGIGHNDGNSETETKPKVKPQFGLHPTELAERFPDEPVPGILIACIEILEQDIRKEGIFRIPGRMTSIVEMKNSFEEGNGLNVEEPNTLDIAGLVAQFFRELPEPLLMYDLYYNWIDAVKKENEEKMRDSIKEMLTKIPEPNYNILKYFIQFLANVGKNSGANRMGPRNLALVFGASLLNPPAIEQYDLANIKLQCSVIEHMITGYSYIFEDIADSGAAAQKVREKQVATIPAGIPGASNTTTTQPPPSDRRKGFMKRKSTFFATLNHSSSKNADMITLHNQPQKASSMLQVPSNLNSTSDDKKEKRRKAKRKRSKAKDEEVEDAEVGADAGVDVDAGEAASDSE